MNLFTVVYQGEMHHVSAKQFRAYVCIAMIILSSTIIAVALLGAYQEKQKIIAEINQAIKGNKYARVEGFEFFKDLKDRAYITTDNYREVADISLTPRTLEPLNPSLPIAGMGSEGTVRTWEGK